MQPLANLGRLRRRPEAPGSGRLGVGELAGVKMPGAPSSLEIGEAQLRSEVKVLRTMC
jgi:hypothetical protein